MSFRALYRGDFDVDVVSRDRCELLDKFLPFKVPLSSRYDDQVPLASRFSMAMLLESAKRTFNVSNTRLLVIRSPVNLQLFISFQPEQEDWFHHRFDQY